MSVNERLTLQERLAAVEVLAWRKPPGCTKIDYLNDWNALKRLEAKARKKNPYLYADKLWEQVKFKHWEDISEVVDAVASATPEQVASAILKVLE